VTTQSATCRASSDALSCAKSADLRNYKLWSPGKEDDETVNISAMPRHVFRAW
jgi:hypothetical protein